MLGKKSAVSWRLHPGAPPPPPHPRANLPHVPTWFRVLCDFCIQARHWSYRRKLRFEQYACFLSQPRNCLSSRRTGPELGSPPRGSHTPPPGPGRSKESGAAVSGRGRQGAHAGGAAASHPSPAAAAGRLERVSGVDPGGHHPAGWRWRRARRAKLVGGKPGHSVGKEGSNGNEVGPDRAGRQSPGRAPGPSPSAVAQACHPALAV